MFEYIDERGKKAKTLLPTSGIENSAIVFPESSETDPFRSSFSFKNKMYHVVGANIYSVDNTGLTIKLNPLPMANSVDYVGVDANNNEIMWVDGVNGYVFNTLTNIFTVKNSSTDVFFPPTPLDICYIDGFMIIITGGTNNFQMSGFQQATIWGPTSTIFTTNWVSGTIVGVFTLASGDNFTTTVPVKVSSSSALPTGLTAGTVYYVRKLSPTTVSLAPTPQDAISGTNLVEISSAGSGTLTMELSGQLQLASVNSHPGTLIACRTLHRRVFFFCEFFTEVWENAGVGTNLPLRRNNALLMEFGCASRGSVVTGFDKMFYLSQDRDGLSSVMMVGGTQSLPVSTRALDFIFAQYAQDPDIGVSDARGILIKENGLIFYRLNFTRANHTYVYNYSMSDQQTQRWHEEETLYFNRHPAQTHVYFNGKNYYGAYNTNLLYLVDPNLVTNNGESIKRTRIGRPFCPPGYQRTRIDRFQLDIVQGSDDEQISFPSLDDITTESKVDILTESGDFLITESSDDDQDITIGDPSPIVFLSYSKDGGATYGPLLQARMGPIGARTWRTVWRKLGVVPRGQAFVPKIEFYSQVPFIVLGAAWFYEVLPQ